MRKSVGITVFGCEQDEANAFRALSPDFHIIPTLISDAISADNAKLAAGNQCVSVGHKSEVSEATILAL
ncbi:TPA: D-lactate dehydrogenase VanH-B, partial [Enterococcus faecium]|nr:D-lactate dehydrogenase VanH-B [Enterococcus faecium]